MKKSYGDMFDPGDWTEEALRKNFPEDFEELNAERIYRQKTWPEYYKDPDYPYKEVTKG